MQTSVQNSLPQCKVKVILKSSLLRFEDVIPKGLRYHVVYTFSCCSFNATYYGKTERHLSVR